MRSGQPMAGPVGGGVARNGSLAWLTEQTLAQANHNDMVWVYYPSGATPPLAEHMNIAHKPVPAAGFGWRIVWRILLKKKKFDRIIVNDQGVAWTLQQLRWVHRARVETR